MQRADVARIGQLLDQRSEAAQQIFDILDGKAHTEPSPMQLTIRIESDDANAIGQMLERLCKVKGVTIEAPTVASPIQATQAKTPKQVKPVDPVRSAAMKQALRRKRNREREQAKRAEVKLATVSNRILSRNGHANHN